MNKFTKILVILIFIIFNNNCESDSAGKIFAQIDLESSGNFKIPVLIAQSWVNAETNNIPDDNFKNLVKKIAQNISLSGQYDVHVKSIEMPKKKSDIKNFSEQGFYLVIFVEQSFDKNFIEFRVYDSALGDMVKGKKIEVCPDIADIISNYVWLELSGEQGVFGTKIAYVKRISNSRNSHKSAVCLSDITGKNELKIVRNSTINIKPQFVKINNILKLFYSEFTAGNVRLMSVMLNGTGKRPVFDFDGTIVGISCSPDGKSAAYCRSGDIWHYTYESNTKKSFHKKIVHDFGNSSCPNLLPNGDIIFGSDYGKTCSIYICKNNLANLDQKINPEKLNISGYCVAPNWCPVNNKIVYSKRVDNNMQLFTYNLNNNKEEQITYNSGNKIDACWSPCGNYLLFCYQNNKTSRIARIHTVVKEIEFVTPESDFCSYPAWA